MKNQAKLGYVMSSKAAFMDVR